MIVRRLAGWLIRVACHELPGPDRVLRCQEWTAEVAAILDDQQARWLHRQVTAVLFAADHLRGARRLARRARRPATGWRADLAAALPPVGAVAIAVPCASWLPLAHLVRLALFELMLAAGMVLHLICVRRYWLAGSTEEFDSARASRKFTIMMWWVMMCAPLVNGAGWDKLAGAGCCLVVIPAMRPLERRIFTRPRLASPAVSRTCTEPVPQLQLVIVPGDLGIHQTPSPR